MKGQCLNFCKIYSSLSNPYFKIQLSFFFVFFAQLKWQTKELERGRTQKVVSY